MGIELVKVTLDEKPLLAEMMQYYLEEMSVYNDEEPDDDGYFEPDPYFDAYWSDATRHPFLIWADGDAVGFCLVRQISIDCFSIAEFYIMETHRKMGIGTAAAHAMFKHFPKRWQISQIETNYPAQAFWNRVIGAFTNGNYQEGWSSDAPQGPMQTFEVEPD